MSVLDWQQAIHERLSQGLPYTKVFLEGVSESTEMPRDPTGLIKPTLILWFGQLNDIATLSSGGVSDLCGTGGGGDGAAKMSAVSVESIAPTGLSLLQLEQAVRDLLTGFAPAGQGQLSETGQAAVRDPFPLGIGDSLRFYKPLFFQGLVTTNVSSALYPVGRDQ